MGYDDIETICKMLGMRRKYKTATYSGHGPDGLYRRCTIHSYHKGNIGAGLLNKIAKEQLLFSSIKEMYDFYHGKLNIEQK
jgi:hypothetical protein